MALTDPEIARYARQLILPGMGETAQEALRSARVRVTGGGRAMAPAVFYLAAAGVGTLWIDDPDEVVPGDGAGFALGPEDSGRARGAALAGVARSVNGLIEAGPFRAGSRPSALLICGSSPDVSRSVADEARLLQLPHVVADVDGQGGAVTSVPVGAPCYACASRPGIGAPPANEGAVTVGALAALELVLLVTGNTQEPRARRVEIFRGTPLTRATVRQPGCTCLGAASIVP